VSIPNVLADRYASKEMVALFDPVNRVVTERRFWLAVLETQIDLGLDVDPMVLEAYRSVIDQVDLESIRRREATTRHDVKSRLDEFCELAGHQDLHKGLTSRDVTENVEQLLTWQALDLVDRRCVALLARLAELAAQYADTVIVGRTHNVAAQPTTVGKRFAMFGEELMIALGHLRGIRDSFALRGIKGPVGSQQDQVDLLGSAEAAAALETRLAELLGIPNVLNAVGQVYPRSLDFSVVSALVQLAAGPANLALLVRLMAGHDLATEGFQAGQVGSSAMPHKMNTRSCERINGLSVILKGHLAMAAGLSGDQWNEGDVSCSVVRRVVMPDAFFTIDGIVETSFAVLNEFGVFPAVIAAELERYLPFLATTKLLMHAVRNEVGRETAHELIKEHAVATALALRSGDGDGRMLVTLLGADDRFPGTADELGRLIADPGDLLGLVDRQVAEFVSSVEALSAEAGPSAAYRGAAIL
jgi:adenylosuccinate lyase